MSNCFGEQVPVLVQVQTGGVGRGRSTLPRQRQSCHGERDVENTRITSRNLRTYFYNVDLALCSTFPTLPVHDQKAGAEWGPGKPDILLRTMPCDLETICIRRRHDVGFNPHMYEKKERKAIDYMS